MFTSTTKYNPLATVNYLQLKHPSIVYMDVILDNDDSEVYTIVAMLGTSKYKKLHTQLAKALVESKKGTNKAKNIYKRLKVLNDVVMLVDFTVSTTIHKTQGKEWDFIIIDYKDLISRCMYDIPRMLFLAMGRAKRKIYLIRD